MKIKSAAIRDQSGRVFTVQNHSEIIWGDLDGVRCCELGFVTDFGLFVGRRVAAVIAFAAGQIRQKTNILIAEDLQC